MSITGWARPGKRRVPHLVTCKVCGRKVDYGGNPRKTSLLPFHYCPSGAPCVGSNLVGIVRSQDAPEGYHTNKSCIPCRKWLGK